MSFSVQFPLQVSPAQAESLRALQVLFAEACNYLAPQVRETRCWNRVALHHLAYKNLRQQFPQLGSQMACNVIYSVCRSARIIYQHPQSPWNISKKGDAALPLMGFMADSPVYFDRHTLSIKDERLSLFTLDGRMHFRLDLSSSDRAHFDHERLREIALVRKLVNSPASDDVTMQVRPATPVYILHFFFGEAPKATGASAAAWEDLPEYLIVHDDEDPAGVSQLPEALALPVGIAAAGLTASHRTSPALEPLTA